jgi:hypothetical protein
MSGTAAWPAVIMIHEYYYESLILITHYNAIMSEPRIKWIVYLIKIYDFSIKKPQP